jgi:hypothetical protein
VSSIGASERQALGHQRSEPRSFGGERWCVGACHRKASDRKAQSLGASELRRGVGACRRKASDSVRVCRECRSVEPRSFAVLNLGASERSVRSVLSIGASERQALGHWSSDPRSFGGEWCRSVSSIRASEHQSIGSLGASEGSVGVSERVIGKHQTEKLRRRASARRRRFRA